MSYTIYKSDGTPITVPDNAIDVQFYDANANVAPRGVGIQLVGRNAVNYGTAIAQNFLQLKENFASRANAGDPTLGPDGVKSLQGQLWFKKDAASPDSTGNLYVKVTNTAGSVIGVDWQQVLTTGSTIVATDADKLTTPRTITATGDASWQVLFDGSSNVTANIALTPVNGNVGTFGSATEVPVFTVDAKGRITAVSNVTISGGGGGGGGTVTSVAASGSSGVTVSGSPITSSGTLTIGLGNITPTSVAASGTVSGSNLSGSNTGDQTITLSGDVTGSGTGAITTTLANSGVTAGSYTNANITIDGKGRITSATAGSAGGLGGCFYTGVSNTFTVPANVYFIHVTCVGAGGGGGPGLSTAGSGGASEYAGRGGGGGAVSQIWMATTPGTNYAISIGAGGTGAPNSATPGGAGGATSFAGLCSADGGQGGPVFIESAPLAIAAGGSGGTGLVYPGGTGSVGGAQLIGGAPGATYDINGGGAPGFSQGAGVGFGAGGNGAAAGVTVGNAGQAGFCIIQY